MKRFKNILNLLIGLSVPCLSLSEPTLTTGNPENFNAAPGGQSLPQTLRSSENCRWALTPATGTGFIMEEIGGDGDPTNGADQVRIIYRPLSIHTACPVTGTVTLRLTSPISGLFMDYPLTRCINNMLPQNEPVDVVMVIDVSGSMGDDASCSSAPADMSKLDYLKDKVPALFDAMHGAFRSNPAHRFGLVSFSDVASPTPLISLTPFSSPTIGTTFNTQVNSLTHGGGTSIGAGLNAAINMLGGVTPVADRTRIIILLTNGEQNVSPMVAQDGLSIGAPANINLSGSDLIILPYAIFTPSGQYLDLLNNLSAARPNGTTSWSVRTTPRVCDVTTNLQDAWVAAAAATGSPKTVAFKSGKLGGTSGSETFNVTENMDALTMYVSSAGTHQYTGLKVEKKDGGTFTDITGLGSIDPPLSIPSKHRVWTVLFPQPSLPVSSGEYRFSFTADQANLAYDVSAIIDDRNLRQAFHVMPIVAAGEPMYLGAQILQVNTPVTDAEVKAIIYVPKTRLNNRFSNKNVPPQFINTKGNFIVDPKADGRKTDDGYIKRVSITHPTLPSFQKEGNNMSLGEKKYLVLLNETNFEKVFDREIIATVPLLHEGNGIYKAAFNGTQKTGLYHVRMEAKGTHSVIGAYERFEEKTPLVRFGTPDLKRSCVFVLYENPLILMIRPIDVENNILGPNQSDAIKIQVEGGSASTPHDYLDGRYVFYLYSGGTQDPFITITIHDRLLYRGPLSKIPHKRWFFSIHGGLTSPLAGDLENDYTGSWFAETRLGVRVYQQWGLQVKGGYYRFSNKLANQVDYELIGLGLGATYRQWFSQASGWYLNAEANLSAYQQIGQNWEWGYNAGLGLQKPLNHFLNLSLDATYHRFGNNPLNTFWTSALGLQWRFGHCHPKKSIFNLP